MAMSRRTYSLRTDADGFPVPRGDEYELLEAVERVLYALRKARNGAEIPIIVIQLFEFSYITIFGVEAVSSARIRRGSLDGDGPVERFLRKTYFLFITAG